MHFCECLIQSTVIQTVENRRVLLSFFFMIEEVRNLELSMEEGEKQRNDKGGMPVNLLTMEVQIMSFMDQK